ncbi:hypothetical protein NE634_14605 [Lacrimispora saccharolytica]|nr:hypothetical protein [Lacrimispora saccharolytica]
MKKIIEGKKYDTETARVVGRWSCGDADDPDDIHRDETLYCKKNGEYFLDNKSGWDSSYHTAFWYDYDYSNGEPEELVPFSLEEAQEWVMIHLNGDIYESEFGEVEE